MAGMERGDREHWRRQVSPRLVHAMAWCSPDQCEEEGLRGGGSRACCTPSMLQRDAGPSRELLLPREGLSSLLSPFMAHSWPI